MDLNAFDLLLLVLVGLLVLLGLWKGFTRLLIAVGALAAAFIFAAQFHRLAGTSILAVMYMPTIAANLVGYSAIWFGTMLAGALTARIMRGLLKAAMLGWADRLAGGAAGFVAALLAAASIVLPVVAYAPSGQRLLRDSVLAPPVTLFSDLASEMVPEELAAQYREQMDALRRFWRERRNTRSSREADRRELRGRAPASFRYCAMPYSARFAHCQRVLAVALQAGRQPPRGSASTTKRSKPSSASSTAAQSWAAATMCLPLLCSIPAPGSDLRLEAPAKVQLHG